MRRRRTTSWNSTALRLGPHTGGNVDLCGRVLFVMASFRELLAHVKSQIREVDPAGAETAMADRQGTVVLDVREPDEYEQGALPGAVHIPRGHLESQIENRVPDRDAPIVVYCAGGTRSAFAAKTLTELGYTDVVSMKGGFNKWKNEGREWQTPQTLSPEQR